METIDLGDGLEVTIREGEFDFRTDGYARLVVEKSPYDVWQLHTDGKWFVLERDINQLIQSLQYVKEAMKCT